LSASAAADLYVATTGTDSGNCPSSDPCATVNYAITKSVSGDIIHIAAGTYHEHIYVTQSVTISGDGMDQTILDGSSSHRVLAVSSPYTVSINDLTIQNGYVASDNGAGIRNQGTLNLTRVKITNNTALQGAGLSTSEPFTIVDSVISNNNANIDSTGRGGGIWIYDSGSASISNTTISGNTSTEYGGGIFVTGSSTVLSMTNVTISGNTSKNGGGMTITIGATVNVVNSTIAGNHLSVGTYGGGFSNFATINFKNSILADNDIPNCGNAGGSLTSQGYNLDSADSCGFTSTGDLINTDPQLGALGNNGGLTQTHALPAGSPAIDAGTNTDCPSTDQRGVSRPLDGDANDSSICDMGAYELKPNIISTYYSTGLYDGWILESTENSTVGGTKDSTSTVFRLGDDASDKQYRAILSFNTASLPDNAIFKKITLKIKKQGLTGLNPFSGFNGLKVDIRKPYFGTTGSLVTGDFQAAAGKSAIATFGATPVSNWYSASIGSTSYSYINKTGTTQFRLRFYLGDNDNASADYMKFFSGNYTTVAARPTLIIEYNTP